MGDLGQAFARAVAVKDSTALRDLLAPDVDFRALTPGRPWEASTADDVVEVVFGSWFEDSDEISALLGVEAGAPVEDTRHVSYRLALRTPDGEYTAEQQAYYRTDGQQITFLRMLCSGYRPAGAAAVVADAGTAP